MVFFWACEVTETKAAVVKIPEDFVLNVCHATLASASNDGVLSLGLEATQMDGKLWKGVVAHLGAAAHAHQVKLDLVVGSAGSQIKFYVAKGTGKVNLTGYFQPGPPSDMFEDPVIVAKEEEPAASTAEAPQKKNNKKRARDEKKASVTWDQAASDSDNETEETKPQPGAKQAKKEEKKQPTEAPAPAQANGATDGAAKKKRKNKNKNKNKEKNDN